MHEARVNRRSGRWILIGGFLLLFALAGLVALWPKGWHKGGGVNVIAGDTAASASPVGESAADKARRAAIAALGPIKKREGTNGADLYKDAMGLYAQLSDADKKMLNDHHSKLDPKVAAALYAKIKPIMDLLRKARRADYVDWGVDFNSPRDALVAVANDSIDLESMVQWDGIYRFTIDPDGAVGDLATGETMLRSEMEPQGLSGAIFQAGSHFIDMRLLAQNASGISDAATSDLEYMTNVAATGQLFQEALTVDAARIQSLLDGSADPATLNRAQGSVGFTYPNRPALAPPESIRDMQWIEQADQEMATAVMEPEPQFQQWWTGKLAEAASTPATNLAVGALMYMRTFAQVSVTENAMFMAGMALEQNNQAQFESINDPATGQPFTYTQTATGFDLGSTLQFAGKAESFSFPAPEGK